MPFSATHIETLISGKVPGRYMLQMQFQLACTGRNWCDYVSYDPRLPERMRLFVKRVTRDAAQIQSLEEAAVTFLNELQAKEGELERLYGEHKIDG